ncbi:MAG: hypothetical protein KGL39_14535 [Patescibacteria group bacterium]|nr:hypothetical protein [Patescibacteria group bacterium]
MKTEKAVSHTPGPWVATYERCPGYDMTHVSLILSGDSSLAHAIARVDNIAPSAGGRVVDMRDEMRRRADARLIAAAPDLLKALKFQASWTMRDGTPCACPAGENESEPKRKMPILHSTACEMLRTAIAKAEEGR